MNFLTSNTLTRLTGDEQTTGAAVLDKAKRKGNDTMALIGVNMGK